MSYGYTSLTSLYFKNNVVTYSTSDLRAKLVSEPSATEKWSKEHGLHG